jgi:hypothetical protein
MADTIVTNTPATSDGGAGWVVALIILIAVAVGGVALYQNGFFQAKEVAPGTTNINVTVPNPLPTPDGATPK